MIEYTDEMAIFCVQKRIHVLPIRKLMLVIYCCLFFIVGVDCLSVQAAESILCKHFNVLSRNWREHCLRVSTSSDYHAYLDDPSYKELVKLGWSVVPFIMAAYEKQTSSKSDDDPCFWNFLLQDITGIKRVESSFNTETEQRFWLQWWKKRCSSLNIDRFRSLKKGMPMSQVLLMFGPPEKDIGSGIHINVYTLADGSVIWVGGVTELFYVDHLRSDGVQERIVR